MAAKIEVTIEGMAITTKVAGIKGKKCTDLIKFLTDNKSQKVKVLSQELTHEFKDGPKVLADTAIGG